jgi:hypothetical protein
MHRIPETPIGLVIRRSRFRLIGEQLTDVLATLFEIRRAYTSARSTLSVDARLPVQRIRRGWLHELDGLIDAAAERAAILRATSAEAVREEAEQGDVAPSTSPKGPADPDEELARRLSALERHLRRMIGRMRSDPPTLLLCVQMLATIERQLWTLEQQGVLVRPASAINDQT